MATRQELLEDVQHNDTLRRERQKTRYDRSITADTTFHPRQAVMLEDTSNKGKRRKLEATFRGPYIVTGYGGEHRRSYTLRQLNGKPIKGHFYGDHLHLFKARWGHLIPPNEALIPEYQLLREPRRRPETRVASAS
ncbi:hypothetical protein CLAFUR4_06066 [Fulvia fulva]|nr:hypothetical protein CLAFUR4_06066 [Fulvia fulva]WPV29546.1 hypothetical protein CLAFUW7_06059 [Fulvia fulva]